MKKIISCIKIQIPAQEANPSPPIGSILGQKGVNIILFCNNFNNESKHIEKGLIVSVIINIYNDKSFNFIIKSTPTSILIKKEISLEKGSSNPKSKIVGHLNIKQIEKIAQIKINDSFSNNIKSVLKSVIGTAKSMGVDIVYN